MEVFTLFIVLYSTLTPTLGVKVVDLGDRFDSFSRTSRRSFKNFSQKFSSILNFTSTSFDARSIAFDMSEIVPAADSLYTKFCHYDSEKCQVVLDKYLKRCQGRDCYTLDGVEVTDKSEKFKLLLPSLTQLDTAFYLFKKAGYASFVIRIKSLLKIGKKNPLLYFTQALVNTNMCRSMSDNTDQRIINEFFYTAALYYKIINNTAFLFRMSMIPLVSFGYKVLVGRFLFKLSKEVAGTNKLSLTISEIDELVDVFVSYVVAHDYARSESFILGFGNLCKKALTKLAVDSQVIPWVKSYLQSNDSVAVEYCEGNESCKEMVSRYVDRCREGDCLTLENVALGDDGDVSVTVPNLANVEFILNVYQKSGGFGNLVDRLFRKLMSLSSSGTLDTFVDDLYSHNIEKLTFENKDMANVTKVLYYYSLYYEKYIFQSILSLLHRFGVKNISKLLVNLNLKHSLEKKFTKIVGDGKLSLPKHALLSIFLEFEAYLMHANEGKYKKLARVYSKTCRDLVSYASDGNLDVNKYNESLRDKRKHSESGDEVENKKIKLDEDVEVNDSYDAGTTEVRDEPDTSVPEEENLSTNYDREEEERET